MRARRLAPLILVALVPLARAEGRFLPRTILALYDGTYDRETKYLPIHQIAEMPLNHLGFMVRYHDINAGLPGPREMEDVRGILTWFQSDAMADPLGFLAWATSAIDAGKKFVVIGEISANRDRKKRPTPLQAINAFWSRLGLRSENAWVEITYDWSIRTKDPRMVDFERRIAGALPAFRRMRRIDPRARSYLVVRRGDNPSTDTDLVVIHRNGAYVAGGFVHYSLPDTTVRQWTINPFEFFRQAFAADELPKLDTTTLSGRRIFYSHVDGDGWHNESEVPGYRQKRALAPEVVLREILQAFPDLPVSVAPIAGDLDPAWRGNSAGLRIAREILALPNVEAGTHTYSHPLDWESLRPGVRNPPAEPGKVAWPSAGLLGRAAGMLFGRLRSGDPGISLQEARASDSVDSRSAAGRAPRRRLRTYDRGAFDLELEIDGSIRYINSLLPPGKKVELVQWSGNTSPFEEAVRASRRAGVRNINGGDTRFDLEYQSYGWVSPLGRQVGRERQVYSSNSNENTYTDLWTDRFFGFKYLVETVERTESPIRVKPHNIYYHMYSGEKMPSLIAVVDNYRFARSRELIPITTSNYAAIVDGFHSARIRRLDDRRWEIRDRGALQTVRFDRADSRGVDFAASRGVVGERRHQGSLYVALDPAEPIAIVAMRKARDADGVSRPYLEQARWLVSNVRIEGGRVRATVRGFGPGEMVWRVPARSSYWVETRPAGGTARTIRQSAGPDGSLRLDLGTSSAAVELTLTRIGTK